VSIVNKSCQNEVRKGNEPAARALYRDMASIENNFNQNWAKAEAESVVCVWAFEVQ
jgi:hypothetical protein